ncbi:MAG: cation diffusion facilitator family transporter [Anaerolineales bacterium]|nr:cation diffusion facilitator family transporter [Anaerolineales bacterium]
MGVSIFLSAIHMVIAIASGSAAVRAEMFHNLSDGLASVAVLLGLIFSKKKSESFPYGLYKLEDIISVILGGMILFTAYEAAHDAFGGHSETITTTNYWMVIGVIVTVIVPYVFSYFELAAGKRANSPSLIAQAKEFRTHILTSGMVLVALLARQVDLPVDLVVSLIIVVVIGKTGIELLIGGLRVLLDASLEDDLLMEIHEIVHAEPAVARIQWIASRNAGRYRYVDICVQVRVLELVKADAAAHRIEANIKQAVPHIERVLVHTDPVSHEKKRYGIPLDDESGTLSAHFSDALYFALVTVNGRGVVDQTILANPFQNDRQRGKGVRVAEWLVDEKVDIVLTRSELKGSGPYYCFAHSGIEMVETEAVSLEKVLAEFMFVDRESG